MFHPLACLLTVAWWGRENAFGWGRVLLSCVALHGPHISVPAAQGLLSLLQIETGVQALTQYEAAATFLVVLVLTSAESQQD